MRRSAASDALAQDAIGDHRNCALQFRLARAPLPLDEAARLFDSAFRVLLTAPANETAVSGGTARVVERHSCAYGSRRFGHVVLRYRGHVVSLLMTANDRPAAGAEARAAAPHLIGRPQDGLSVVSVDGVRHTVLLVSDLDSAALTELSGALSVPLAQRLAVQAASGDETLALLASVQTLHPE
jgi:hypothetical protein